MEVKQSLFSQTHLRARPHARYRAKRSVPRVRPLFLTLSLAALLPAGVAWAQAAGNEWTTAAGAVQGTRFSSLNQITPANVGGLVQEFSFSTGVQAGHEGQPLVIGSTMYVVGPLPNRLFAVDLTRPGQIKWTFSPRPSPYAQDKACCDIVNRGPAYYNGKIIYNALDNTVVAVNATTGAQVWRTSMGDPHTGQTITMAPLIVGKVVLIGNSGGEMGVRGWVAGLNGDTGAVIWKAFNTGPDADVKIGPRFHPFYPKDQGTNLGATTWPGTLWQTGGATSWAWFTYDPVLNLVYHGTANPGPWNPDVRPGDNKWSSTIFARDPATGEAIWAYQTVPHDSWDFDSMNESIVTDLSIGGATRHVLVHFNKNGFAYVLDAATGQVLSAPAYDPAVNWATGIDLASGLPSVNPAKVTHEGVVVSDICPAPLGGKDEEPAAFSPATGLFYIPSINVCVDYEALKVNYIQGAPFVGAMTKMKAGPGGNRGELIAWNASSGSKAWGIPEKFPVYSGVLATAGNLVFYGTMDRIFKAVNATTGQVVFQKQLPSGIIGNPITFLGPDGKQRVAIYAGVGGAAGGLVPGKLALDDPYAGQGIVGAMADLPAATPPGGTVHVFKLP